jgi:hypothetical protein
MLVGIKQVKPLFNITQPDAMIVFLRVIQPNAVVGAVV